jgi:hypothetical protein
MLVLNIESAYLTTVSSNLQYQLASISKITQNTPHD